MQIFESAKQLPGLSVLSELRPKKNPQDQTTASLISGLLCLTPLGWGSSPVAPTLLRFTGLDVGSFPPPPPRPCNVTECGMDGGDCKNGTTAHGYGGYDYPTYNYSYARPGAEGGDEGGVLAHLPL